MTGRVYLDHNATAPLRPEARKAMAGAMDVVGNPSSVHAEGRAARAIVERARAQIAEAMGAGEVDIVFTSGATEAAAMALRGRGLRGAAIEHDAVRVWIDEGLAVDDGGQVTVPDPAGATLQLANSETGVVQALPPGLAVSDVTQGFGKLPFAFSWSGIGMAFASAHKIGGPKGIGALVMPRGADPAPILRGGGQESGWRAGTENVIGIAGFGAAAQAAARDLADGVWDAVAERRDLLEAAIEAEVDQTIFVGNSGPRLPNTSCIIAPGWKGETQVMAMDLAGFAISAGSACSSGKVRASHVLGAMGYAEDETASAIRVSLGPDTTKDAVLRFAESWCAHYGRQRARVA